MPSRLAVTRQTIIVLALSLGALFFMSQNLETNDLIAGDEGYYGIMARNIEHGVRYLANPSLTPLGEPGDKPFLFPAVLALGLKMGGVREASLRFVTLLFAVGTGLMIYAVGRELRMGAAAIWAAVLYLTSPALAYSGRVVAAEAALVSLSLAGSWFFLRALRTRRVVGGLLAGGLYGAAFLCKLWLFVPIAGATVVGALLAGSGEDGRRPWACRTWLNTTLLAAAGFMLIGGAQLLLCAIVSPETIAHWLKIYFGFSLTSRVAGKAFAGYWHKPWHFYFGLLAQSAALILPLALLGIATLGCRNLGRRKLSVFVLGLWMLPIVPLSFMAVKTGNYLHPLMPAVFLFAGLGLSAALSGLERPVPKRHVLLVGAGASFLITALRAALGPVVNQSARYLVPFAIQSLWVVALLILATWTARGRLRRMPRMAVLTCLSVTVLAGVGRSAQLVRAHDHVTGFREIARAVEGGLAECDPRQICFLAPEAPALSFYLFRSGRYWESPYLPALPELTEAALDSADPFLFVIPRRRGWLYGGSPDSTSLQRIRDRAVPVTSHPGTGVHTMSVYANQALAIHLGV